MANKSDTMIFDYMTKVIEATLKEAVKKAADKAIAQAQSSIEQEVYAEVDKIALSILRNYSVMDMGNRIVIEVKKNG